jgi:hypothetical protein
VRAGHQALARVLRLPPDKLTRREWLMIDLLDEEGLCHCGNVSITRAKKMSAQAKAMLFG